MIKKYIFGAALMVVTVLILFQSIFPNYYAFLKTPTNKVFSGQDSWFDPWDINVYVAAINWGQHNGILLENNYTTKPGQAILYYFTYTLSGALFPGVNPFFLYHLLSLFTGAVLLFVIWKTLRVFLQEKIERLLILTLVALGGGVGWLFFPRFPSADLFMTGFTFASQLQRPHEALGVMFYLLSLLLFYRQSLWAILTLSLLAFFYPFYILSFGVITGIYSLILHLRDGETSQFKYWLANLLLSAPFFIAYSFYLSQEVSFTGVVSQNLPTPGILEIIAGYGILLPLSLFAVKSKSKHLVFLLTWFWVSLLLSYLPFGFARFYLRGLFYPLVILAWIGLNYLFPKYKLPRKTSLLILALLVCASSFYITYRRVAEAGGTNHWIYYTKDEIQALSVLKPNDKVLAGYNLGNFIPAATEATVYFGHLLQTPQAEEKYRQLALFYGNLMDDVQARQFVASAGVNLILYGFEEKNITKIYSQSEKLKYSFLKPSTIYGGLTIFEY